MGRDSGRSPAVPVAALLAAVSGPAILAAVLQAAVDSPARPVGAAVSDPASYVSGGADVTARQPDW